MYAHYKVPLIFCKYFKERGMRYRIEKILKKKIQRDLEYLVNNTAGRGH